jgi:ABC-type lipoprotein export system ATPase subunit
MSTGAVEAKPQEQASADAALGATDANIIVVTHDEKIIPIFKRIHHIRDGRTFDEAGEGRTL